MLKVTRQNLSHCKNILSYWSMLQRQFCTGWISHKLLFLHPVVHYVTFLIVFVGCILWIGFCKRSLMTDRLHPNQLHEQGSGIIFCKTPRLFTQCTPERTSLLQRFTASLYTAGALKKKKKKKTNSKISLGSHWYMILIINMPVAKTIFLSPQSIPVVG